MASSILLIFFSKSILFFLSIFFSTAAPSKITSTFKKASICSKKSPHGLKIHLHQYPIKLEDSDSVFGNAAESNPIKSSNSNQMGCSESNLIGNCKKCNAAQPCGWHHTSNALWRELENSPFNKRKNKEVAWIKMHENQGPLKLRT